MSEDAPEYGLKDALRASIAQRSGSKATTTPAEQSTWCAYCQAHHDGPCPYDSREPTELEQAECNLFHREKCAALTKKVGRITVVTNEDCDCEVGIVRAGLARLRDEKARRRTELLDLRRADRELHPIQPSEGDHVHYCPDCQRDWVCAYKDCSWPAEVLCGEACIGKVDAAETRKQLEEEVDRLRAVIADGRVEEELIRQERAIERHANLNELKAALNDDAVIDGARAVMKVGLEQGADPKEITRRALGYVIMRAFGLTAPIMETVQ